MFQNIFERLSQNVFKYCMLLYLDDGAQRVHIICDIPHQKVNQPDAEKQFK